jgi:hypothetical protein
VWGDLLVLIAVKPNPQLLIMLAWLFGIGLGCGLLLIALGVAAKILQAACRIVGAPAPETGRAMITSALESLAGAMIGASGAIGLALIHSGGLMDRTTAISLLRGLQVTTAFIVPAALYVPMLNISFSRGIAVSVVRVLLTGLLILTIGVGVAVATGRLKF